MTGTNDPDSTPQLDEHERWITTVLAEARARDRAPSELRARLAEQERSAGRGRTGRQPTVRRRAWVGPLIGSGPIGRGAGAISWGTGAFGLAAVLLVLVLALPSGTPGAPSLSQAAALATRGPAGPAPAADPTDPTRLELRVGTLAFPTWSARQVTGIAGARTDRLRNRRVVTVYYNVSGRLVAYSIVATPTLSVPHSQTVDSRGYWFHILRHGGRTIVTWTERGHTCIVSAAGVAPAFLQRLVTG